MRSVAIILLMCAAFGQARRAGTDTRPQFEVASIRPADSTRGVSFSGSRFTASGISARLLIEMAYELQPYRLSGAPGWIDSELYNLHATWSGANGTRFREMLQRLLEDRFHLQMGRESKEQSLYALQVRDKGKLQPTKTPGRSATYARAEDRNVRTEYIATTMGRFAEILSRESNRVIVDETGLTGEYDFVLQTEREVDEKNMFTTPLAPSLGQIGLKLESRRGHLDFYTIKTIEHPSEN
ncbi:MAG TPA: TIGR03435 family protein [Bryobacteraceae bacterium]|nr:TIGR03435 family protein [Bryobacteraceae bacterium]